MPNLSRRDFVAGSAFTALSYAKVQGANERLRIGVIGCGGQAMGHMRALVKMRESDNCDILTRLRRLRQARRTGRPVNRRQSG